MKEIKAILTAYNNIDITTQHAALATVVKVEGSSYRRMGARMLVLDDGHWVGGISGGCLEGDALKHARMAILKSTSTLITYDTTKEDEYQLGVGLGCNGVIEVLFTALNFEDKNNPVEVLKKCIGANRQTHVLISIINLKGDWQHVSIGKMIEYVDAKSLYFLNNELLQDQLENAVTKQLSINKSTAITFTLIDGKSMEVFIEIILPEINVIIMGHQYDVYPLTRLLKEIGWRVTIVASPIKLNKNIIASADEIILPQMFTHFVVDTFTVILLMSHDFKTDKNNLPLSLATCVPYIGILGPKDRFNKILVELDNEGCKIASKDLDRIYAPIGLDIGAVTSEEIALSFAAEIRAFFSGRSGGFLKLRDTTIHERNHA